METTRKRRWWQFGLREAIIATGGLGMELAIIRAIVLYRAPLDGIMNLLAGFAALFLLGLPIGVTAGLIAKRWKVAVLGTLAGAAIWFGALRLFVTIDEGIRDLRLPTITAPPAAP